MRRLIQTAVLAAALLVISAPAAWACGFLVSANGAVRLQDTATFVTWENGIEHYITNFTFSGEVESFGSLIPLPSVPTDVRRAGDWTLQRLEREVNPDRRLGLVEEGAVFAAADTATVLFRTQIDSLDVVVLEGGASAVFNWVNDNGFNLPPGDGTQHMLEFYASRSPYFLAARFDADLAAADGFVSGDGIPVQITMPTPRPWVPLHILHGATPDREVITADIYLLTPDRPELLYGEGITIERSEWASDLLLDDLRSDANMEWVPEQAWFTYLDLETEASNLTYDLSVGVDESGPSFLDAGLTRFEPTPEDLERFGLGPAWSTWDYVALVAAVVAAGVLGGIVATRRRPRDRSSETLTAWAEPSNAPLEDALH